MHRSPWLLVIALGWASVGGGCGGSSNARGGSPEGVIPSSSGSSSGTSSSVGRLLLFGRLLERRGRGRRRQVGVARRRVRNGRCPSARGGWPSSRQDMLSDGHPRRHVPSDIGRGPGRSGQLHGGGASERRDAGRRRDVRLRRPDHHRDHESRSRSPRTETRSSMGAAPSRSTAGERRGSSTTRAATTAACTEARSTP